MTDAEMIEAQGGVLLAHTALITAVLQVLRENGSLTGSELDIVFDSAFVGVENASTITPETNRQARVVLEHIAREMTGKPRRDPV